MTDDFDTALTKFLTGCERRANANRPEVLGPVTISAEYGPRYVRVVRGNASQRSAHCFVDRRNGDVLKSAGWKAPAKHARGNIFAPDNGLGCMGPYGAAYLR